MIIDTNAVSALLAGDGALEQLLTEVHQLGLPVIVLGEYRYGLLRSTRRERLESLFDHLVEVSEVLAIDSTTTRFYAQARERLRALGRPIPENDLWIAALGLQHRQPVVSRDRHFDAVEGLTRLEW